jgi:hypothetical protein
VEDLSRVSGVPGVANAVALANTADSEDQARFLADWLDMLANYYQTQTPLLQIIARGTFIGRDRASVIVVPAQVDYVVWIHRTSYFANRRDLASPKRGVWLSGQVSPLAKRNFEALGWSLAREPRFEFLGALAISLTPSTVCLGQANPGAVVPLSFPLIRGQTSE